jgi:lysophospholipase L1-like esterase
MIKEQDVIVFQGDSITDCGRARPPADANTGLGSGYASRIADKLLATHPSLRIHNRGTSGNQVIHLADRWQSDVIDLQPDLLSVLIGVNDTWRGFDGGVAVPVDRYEQVYRQILTDARQANPDLRLVLCEPFVLVTGTVTEEWLPEINTRREIVTRLCGEFDATFVPFQAAFDQAAAEQPANHWLGDGVHPTPAGHDLMAKMWLETVA